MKICPKCGNALADDAQFCTLCGAKIAAPQQEAAQDTAAGSWEPVNEEPAQGMPNQENTYQQTGYQQPYGQPVYQQPVYDPYDHTAEFDPKDISDNKVVAMIPYILGIPGMILAALLGANSPYAMFHIRQELKFTVVETLVGIVAAVLCWTFLIPIAAGIFLIVLVVLEFICFFQVCGGKAKEAAIIRSIGFLK